MARKFCLYPARTLSWKFFPSDRETIQNNYIVPDPYNMYPLPIPLSSAILSHSTRYFSFVTIPIETRWHEPPPSALYQLSIE